eukprot:15536551-Heterocapsa_arctica.AAC.1
MVYLYTDALLPLLALANSSAQRSSCALLDITGHTLNDARNQAMAPVFIYVGFLLQLPRLLRTDLLKIDIMPGRRE